MVRRCLCDPTFSCFSRTPTCDRQTDRQTTMAHTALAWRRAVKSTGAVSPACEKRFDLIVKIRLLFYALC